MILLSESVWIFPSFGLHWPRTVVVVGRPARSDLAGRPTTTTVRGQCSPKDGKIHTDSLSKIITVLLYMNPGWEQAGGRLRLLRSGNDLEDMIAEVPPLEG